MPSGHAARFLDLRAIGVDDAERPRVRDMFAFSSDLERKEKRES